MAILWFLSCLALLGEVYGRSFRDIFLEPSTLREDYAPYVVKTQSNSTIYGNECCCVKELVHNFNPELCIVMGKIEFMAKVFIIKWPGPITLPQEQSPVCIASRYDVFNNGDNCVTTNLTYTCDSSTSANNQQVTGQKLTEATSDNRQQVTVPILTSDECQKRWGTKSQKNKICTGLSSCMVAPGAGLLCKRNGTWIMAGIATSSCSKSKPAMFTHMSAFRGWIEETIPDN